MLRQAGLALATAAAVAGLAAGCGGGSGNGKTGTPASPAATSTTPATETPAQLRMSEAIHAWSAALNHGNYAAIARLFAVPAFLIQSPYEWRMTTRAEIARWHSLLPCAGTVVTIRFRGDRSALAVFRLGTRKGFTCDAPGGLAAARYTFRNGKIVRWEQVAVPKNVGHTGIVA